MDRQSFESLIDAGAFGPSCPFVTEDQEWEIPIPFDEISTPDFPTESLPSTLTSFVESVSESTQTPEEMAGILRECAPEAAADRLLQAALDHGGRDNISFVILKDQEGAQ